MKIANVIASLKHEQVYPNKDIFAIDNGAAYLSNYDVIAYIGDMDSIDKQVYQSLDKSKIIKLNPIKDVTDLEYAIDYIIGLGYDHLNIYGAIGQRLDHTLTNINLLKKYQCITFYDDYSKIEIHQKDDVFTKDSSYKYYSFFALQDTIISLIDFVYPLNNYLLSTIDTLCISNEVLDNPQIKTNQDIIIIYSK